MPSLPFIRAAKLRGQTSSFHSLQFCHTVSCLLLSAFCLLPPAFCRLRLPPAVYSFKSHVSDIISCPNCLTCHFFTSRNPAFS